MDGDRVDGDRVDGDRVDGGEARTERVGEGPQTTLYLLTRITDGLFVHSR